MNWYHERVFLNERVMLMKRLVPGMVLLLIFVMAGCSKNTGKGGGPELGSVQGQIAGVKWTIPKRWTMGPERPMRAATYVVPATEEGGESAECAVSYFGAGQGGVVDANIDRWVGQFEKPVPPEKSVRDVDGLKVTTVQINGTYLGMGGMMAESSPRKENYRLLGAIIEGPQGMIFFKMTGLQKTVGGAEKEFDAMVGSLTK
jgi:predicted small secreted protein